MFDLFNKSIIYLVSPPNSFIYVFTCRLSIDTTIGTFIINEEHNARLLRRKLIIIPRRTLAMFTGVRLPRKEMLHGNFDMVVESFISARSLNFHI